MYIKRSFKQKKVLFLLSGLFILALILRFLYFPGNTQFAYDHARDAFTSLQVLAGEFKIIGPPTTGNANLNHGVLFYYFAGPIYWLFGGNPEGLSLVLRIYNALGVFLIFALGAVVANKRIGLVAAFLYAVSFEQTQYGLYMVHPTMASLTTMLFYLGFALLIFQKKSWGLILAAVGFGLSLQFHMGLIYLAPLFILYPLVFRKHLPKIEIKMLLFSALGFALTTSTFILADLKYNFRTVHGLISLVTERSGNGVDVLAKLQSFLIIINRSITDNFFFLPFIGVVLLGVLFYWIIRQKGYRTTGIFLLIWFIWGLVPYYFTDGQIYFYGVGTSISLLVLGGILINILYQTNKRVGIVLVSLIIFSNLWLILQYNPNGPINAFTSQDGMLLKDEEKIIDFTYQKAEGKPFAINGLTVPYGINTTWSYLYDWYGKKKYGYVPVWGGSHADGFPTALTKNTARSTLPEKRFLLIEPRMGISDGVTRSFLKEEDRYAARVYSHNFGLFIVYEQNPILK